jgi:hypothetical protein
MKYICRKYKNNESCVYGIKGSKANKKLMYSSLDGGWSKLALEKGLAYSLVTVNEGFILKDNFTSTDIAINFCQMEALQMLLKLIGEEFDVTCLTETTM